jgi:hypothetical protein
VTPNEVQSVSKAAIERLRALREEIAHIRQMNETYETMSDMTLVDLQAHQARRGRLQEIVRELSSMRLPVDGA